MKICKKYFGEFEKPEVGVVYVSPATELDSGFCRNDRGERRASVENINNFCPQYREELGVMDLLGFGL